MTAPGAPARPRPWLIAGAVCLVVVVATTVGARRLTGLPGSDAAARPAVTPSQTVASPTYDLPRVTWRPRWHDEFNGTGPPANWTALSGTAYSRKALHYYSPANAVQDGAGHLVITARETRGTARPTCWYGPCRYSSARIETRGVFAQTYGRFAARIKLPLGRGLWPAFWLKRVDAGSVDSATYGEIDIVENRGHETHLVRAYTHSKGRKGGGRLRLPERLDAGFHVYGVDWTPQSITWWVDGKAYAQYPRYPHWPFDKPFYLILNLQVGGGWVGDPDDTTPFPAKMIVDWVRVYQAEEPDK